MDNQWKCEYCETCDFPTWYEETEESEGKMRGICRKHPPCIMLKRSNLVDAYPSILKSNLACSCWREKKY